jgi:hypothetical protein
MPGHAQCPGVRVKLLATLVLILLLHDAATGVRRYSRR